MTVSTSSFSEQMINAYKYIINENEYAGKGMRRYRVFIYIYHFGCIQINDLPYIFPEDSKPGMQPKELLNQHRSMLNYLYKDNLIEKLVNGFYTLKNKGLNVLYEHLKDSSMLHDIEFQQFMKGFVRKTQFLSHSSKTGRAVHSFVRSYNYNFLCEPIIDYEGNILSASFYNSSSRAFLPDALFFNEQPEIIYLEADSSLERINCVISKKIIQYTSVFQINEQKNIASTLHFSVWNKESDTTLPLSYDYELSELYKIHSFLSSDLGLDYTFPDFIKFIINYNGNYEPVITLLNFLNSIGVTTAVSEKQFIFLLKTNLLYSVFNKSFYKRQTGVFNIIKKNPELIESLLNGNRFIFAPLNSSKNLLNCIYLEHLFTSFFQSFFTRFFNTETHVFLRKNIVCFTDEISGERYIFRNVFTVKIDDIVIQVVVENISEDFGGRLRIKNFLSKTRSHSIRDLQLICVFNSQHSSSPARLVSDSKIIYNDISFISYENFLTF